MKIKSVASLLILLWLAVSTLSTIGFVGLAKANGYFPPERLPVGQAYIKSNGDVEPSTLPIQRSGNTYVLKENIANYSIAIETDGVVIDGNGFSLTIPSYGEKGKDGQVKSVPALIQITNRTDITIKNFRIFNCATAIRVFNSSYITIADNTITQCNWIYMHSCSHCTIIRNILNNNQHGLYGYEVNQIDIKYNQICESSWHAVNLRQLSNSNIIGNIFARNDGQGICYLGSNNRVIGNTFQDNEGGISSHVEGNEIHHNNFINNGYANRNNDISINAPNILDDGKEGNYWSSNQNSQPLVIPSTFTHDNEANIDHFPRMSPYIFDYQPPLVGIVSPENKTYENGNFTLVFSASKEISRAMYSVDGNERVALSNDTLVTGLPDGRHNLTVYAEDVFGNEGTSETITFTIAEKPETEPESFPTTIVVVASGSSVAVVIGAGLLVYFRKRGRGQNS